MMHRSLSIYISAYFWLEHRRLYVSIYMVFVTLLCIPNSSVLLGFMWLVCKKVWEEFLFYYVTGFQNLGLDSKSGDDTCLVCLSGARHQNIEKKPVPTEHMMMPFRNCCGERFLEQSAENFPDGHIPHMAQRKLVQASYQRCLLWHNVLHQTFLPLDWTPC